MPVRIVINGASFPQRVTGVQRYARELASRLLQHPDVKLIVPSASAVPNVAGHIDVVTQRRLTRALGLHGWANVDLRFAIDSNAILWSPTVRAPILMSRHVPTVHDLAPFDHPEWFSRTVAAQHRFVVPRLLERAPMILADSAFTRDRLGKVLGVGHERIRIVPCGVGPEFAAVTAADCARVRQEMGLPERFVLSVASHDPRKNLRMLVQAWSELPGSLRREAPLLLAGGRGPQFSQEGDLGQLPDGVRTLGYVPDEDLPALYSCASVFAYPSDYEGFGLPPLEAMAAGTPVVAFRHTLAICEVADGAAVLVEDRSASAMSEALSSVLSDPTFAHDLERRGRARAAHYTWERAALLLRAALLEAHEIPYPPSPRRLKG